MYGNTKRGRGHVFLFCFWLSSIKFPMSTKLNRLVVIGHRNTKKPYDNTNITHQGATSSDEQRLLIINQATLEGRYSKLGVNNIYTDV